MAFSRTWIIDKYKSEFESEEHWELRKKFMETHKDKFPEEKLVCLARVFFNIEFLGCRYPEKTMQLIATLSEGVADEHREKQKGKLKRTFVQASDAANSKVTRSSSSAEPPKKLAKTSEEDHKAGYSCFVHASLVKPTQPKDPGPIPGFILFESCNSTGQISSCPISILLQSTQKNLNSGTVAFDFLPAESDPANPNRIFRRSTGALTESLL